MTMQIIFPQSRGLNWRVMLSRLGYHDHIERKSRQLSYIHRLKSLQYPRFHVYLEMLDQDVRLNIHLDEKMASYEGQTRHSGDYDGELVRKEVERIKQFIMTYGQ